MPKKLELSDKSFKESIIKKPSRNHHKHLRQRVDILSIAMEDIKRSHEKFSGAEQLKSKREAADWLDRARETGKQSVNLRESKGK